MTPEEFYRALAKLGIRLTAFQKQQFNLYYRFLMAVNQHLNLTSIVGRPAVYLKHFYDSITPARYIEGLRHCHWSVCDVGSGAGFPSLPLKIIFPQLRITIIDSLNKRVNFLRQLIKKLRLTGVKLYHSRAEIFGSRRSSHREQYDLVIARAVARMNVLSEFCLPLVKVGGLFVAMKSVHADDELNRARTAISLLGGRLIKNYSLRLPISQDLRQIIVIRKRKRTPDKYPRRAGVPNRQPL